MEKNNFLRFVICWVILSEGFAFLSDKRPADASNLLVRKRRVIDRTHNANPHVGLRDAFYVVNIKKNGVHACAGSILSTQVIVTTANCINNENARYNVISGTVSTISGGKSHLVNGILRHPLYNPASFVHNIALLSVNPPIICGKNINRPIPIFLSNNGQLPVNTHVTVSGYGHIIQHQRDGLGCIRLEREQRMVNPNKLSSISLPTITLQDCRVGNPDDHFITNEIICTFHGNKSCSPGEYGNPLVFNGQLVGILVLDGYIRGSDIFVNVAYGANRNWILSHMSPAKIPQYVPPPPGPASHHHKHPQQCARVHPCNDVYNG